MSPAPFLFFRLLADQKLQPAAVELQVAGGDMNALLPFVTADSFSSFASAIPCHITVDRARQMPYPVLQALTEAGCLTTGKIQSSNDQKRPALSADANWLGGDWYLAPPAKMTTNQAASRALSLKLLQLVATDADTFQIESIFRQDPVLSYQLLRLVNSLGVGTGKHISSFSQAILILGRQQLKRWLNLMLFAANPDDYRSAMLIARVAVRARSMELLAKASGLDRPMQEQAFMSGMFALLGVLFGSPLVDILRPLKLNDSLVGAVLDHRGQLGDLLQIVEKAERTEEYGLVELLDRTGVTRDDLNLINLDAHRWMLSVTRERKDRVND